MLSNIFKLFSSTGNSLHGLLYSSEREKTSDTLDIIYVAKDEKQKTEKASFLFNSFSSIEYQNTTKIVNHTYSHQLNQKKKLTSRQSNQLVRKKTFMDL